MAHAVSISTRFGDKLLFKSMIGEEQLGRLFDYDLRLLSRDANVTLSDLLGTPMTVTVTAGDGTRRYFNGIVNEAGQLGYQTVDGLQYAQYSVRLVPKPWLLTRKRDCRIFKQMSVPDMVKKVLSEIGYTDLRLSLTGTYTPREYCVQYREDYFNFISRLMEQEGIYYYFQHSDGVHTMVLADGLGAHSTVPHLATIPYRTYGESAGHDEAVILGLDSTEGVHTTRYQLTDFDPLKPKASLMATKMGSPDEAYSAISSLESFDYPGSHVVVAKGEHYAQVRLEALNVPRRQVSGSSNAHGLATGALFTLADFPRAELNKEYLLTGTAVEVKSADYASHNDDSELFSLSFTALQSALPFRAMPLATKPRIDGVQTATVVGAKSTTDEDIEVDNHGRIRVRFHWQTTDRTNAQLSCVARVATFWAGKQWGGIHIPRIGQEVVVSFLDGDPDYPLVTGSVYNADHMPPYTLPANKTQSGVKSRSLLGAAADFNELRFEDKKGAEDFFMHAQKDMHEEVEHDHFVQVTNNETTDIGKIYKLTAGTEIHLVTGASSIVMKSTGDIEIKGVNIKITGNATVDIGGTASVKVHSQGTTDVEAAAMTTVKGATLMLNGQGLAQLAGGMIMIG